MLEIFAIVQCMNYTDPKMAVASGCMFIGQTFTTAEACKQRAALLPSGPDPKAGVIIEFRCVSKTVETWKPVD